METVHFSSSPEIFARAQVAFDDVSRKLVRLIPRADVQHVGSTAVPGSLTKGDLNIQVRVEASDFKAAKRALLDRYQSNPTGFWSAESASFKDDDSDLPIGLHLTVIGCADDIQWRLRDALVARRDFREQYNALKRQFEGRSMASYRDAKGAFFEGLKKSREFVQTARAT